MRRLAIAASGVVVLGIVSAALLARNRSGADGVPGDAAGAAPATRPAVDRLVVHEWGTFTGFAAPDGTHLPFATTVGSDLPPFVDHRQRHAIDNGHEGARIALFLKASGVAALQRMETPVLYFYAGRPRDVDVRVDFPGGVLTEFYPPVRRIGPAYGRGLGDPAIGAAQAVAATRPFELDGNVPRVTAAKTRPAGTAAGADASFLDWGRVRIVPRPSGDDGKLVPPVLDQNHYQFARETDADLVQVDLPGGKRHEERFLFYRGLGNFALPVRLAAKGGDRFELTSAGPQPLGTAFLIETRAAGSVRFATLSNVSGAREATLPREGVPEDRLAEAIVSALVAEGLYEREARAMVKTWRASWLGEPGTRVLYTLPRPMTDGLLPLRVSPAPDEVARVFVGRIDVLTPERESRLRSMLSAAADGPPSLSDEDVQTLEGLGRFRRPALDHAAGVGSGPTGFAKVKRVLDAYAAQPAGAKLR